MARPIDPKRKEEVLERAVFFLAEHGLAGLNLRKLAADLGVSTNVISYQFGSKEGLIQAALDRARAANSETLATLRAENPDITTADTLRGIWKWWRERPERFAYPRLSIEAMMAADDLSGGKRLEVGEFWNEYATGWLVKEGRSPAEAEELASAMNGLLTGLVIDMISTGDLERIDRTLERFASLIEPQ